MVVITYKKMKNGNVISRLTIIHENGSTQFSEATIDEAIIDMGYLPKSIMLPLEQYLAACELPYIVQREDGVYYKGIRLVADKK